MRRRLTIVATAVVVSVVAGALMAWALRSLDHQGMWFALAVVWLPMAWLGSLSHVVPVRLPDSFHELRAFERNGRCYELVGVTVFKRLLRRGPLAVFNPNLHLPSARTPERIAELDRRMRSAEASHTMLFVLTLPVAANALLRAWWTAAGWTLLFDVLVNGYPAMLQRYNRAWLARCHPDTLGRGFR